MPEILLLRLDKILFRKLINGVRDFQALSKTQTDWRLAQKDSIMKKDLFASLVEAKDPKTGGSLTEEQLIAETGSLLLAGADTQGTALAAKLLYCLHYPTTIATLQHEIPTTIPATIYALV